MLLVLDAIGRNLADNRGAALLDADAAQAGLEFNARASFQRVRVSAYEDNRSRI